MFLVLFRHYPRTYDNIEIKRVSPDHKPPLLASYLDWNFSFVLVHLAFPCSKCRHNDVMMTSSSQDEPILRIIIRRLFKNYFIWWWFRHLISVPFYSLKLNHCQWIVHSKFNLFILSVEKINFSRCLQFWMLHKELFQGTFIAEFSDLPRWIYWLKLTKYIARSV